jgi:hypothetical protein
MTELTNTTKEQTLKLLNLHLKNHPDFIEGMHFDDLSIENGRYLPKAHFFLDENNRPTETTSVAQRVYNEVFSDFLP